MPPPCVRHRRVWADSSTSAGAPHPVPCGKLSRAVGESGCGSAPLVKGSRWPCPLRATTAAPGRGPRRRSARGVYIIDGRWPLGRVDAQPAIPPVSAPKPQPSCNRVDVRGVPPFPIPPFPVADEVPLTRGRGRLYPPSRAAMAALLDGPKRPPSSPPPCGCRCDGCRRRRRCGDGDSGRGDVGRCVGERGAHRPCPPRARAPQRRARPPTRPRRPPPPAPPAAHDGPARQWISGWGG